MQHENTLMKKSFFALVMSCHLFATELPLPKEPFGVRATDEILDFLAVGLEMPPILGHDGQVPFLNQGGEYGIVILDPIFLTYRARS